MNLGGVHFMWIDRSCERLARDFVIRIFIGYLCGNWLV